MNAPMLRLTAGTMFAHNHQAYPQTLKISQSGRAPYQRILRVKKQRFSFWGISTDAFQKWGLNGRISLQGCIGTLIFQIQPRWA